MSNQEYPRVLLQPPILFAVCLLSLIIGPQFLCPFHSTSSIPSLINFLKNSLSKQINDTMGNVLRSLYGHCCNPATTTTAPHGVSALAHDISQFDITSQVIHFAVNKDLCIHTIYFSFRYMCFWLSLVCGIGGLIRSQMDWVNMLCRPRRLRLIGNLLAIN